MGRRHYKHRGGNCRRICTAFPGVVLYVGSVVLDVLWLVVWKKVCHYAAVGACFDVPRAIERLLIGASDAAVATDTGGS